MSALEFHVPVHPCRTRRDTSIHAGVDAISDPILTPIALARRHLRTLRSIDVRRVAAAGLLLLGVNYALLFWGAQFIPSGLVAILQSGTPLLALALACAAGQQRVTARKLFTLILGVVGVTLIFGSEVSTSGRAAMTGVAAVLGSSACVASAYVWMKSYEVASHHWP